MALCRTAAIQPTEPRPFAQSVHWSAVLTSLVAGAALIGGFSVVASTALSHDPVPPAPITATAT